MRPLADIWVNRCLLAAILFIFGSGVLSAGNDWASFQNGGQVSLPSSAAVGEWKLGTDLAWTADLTGYGQSSPVVWGEHVYVTSVEGPEKETYLVSAYALADGKQVWQHKVKNATPQESSNYVSRAAPTPAADAAGVICFFEGGNLLAFTHGGDVRWERNLAAEYGEISSRHGLAASVAQDEQSAFIWVERSEEPYVLSVDKKTGENNWKVAGLGATSWSSPRLVPVADGDHLVLSASGHLVGLDPKSGERLWAFEGISGNTTPTPVPLGDGRFLIGATVGRGNSDAGKSAKSNGVIQITKNDDGTWKADYIWRAKRATSSFSSPMAHNGTAYFINKTGVVFGLDLETGQEKFNKRLGGGVWATPIGIGELVMICGRDGKINLLANNGDDQELSTWEALPEDAEPVAGEKTDRFSASVLYSALWSEQLVLLRRGEALFAVKVVRE